MTMIPLTSEAIVQSPWVDHKGGLILIANTETRELWHRSVGQESKIVRTSAVPLHYETHASFWTAFMWASGPSVKNVVNLMGEPGGPESTCGWQCQWAAEQARRAAFDGNWEAFGKRIDVIWSQERALSKVNNFDLFYASLRTAGVYGGRFFGEGIAMIVNPQKRQAVKEVFARMPGWRVEE